jgi:hypothetical protein
MLEKPLMAHRNFTPDEDAVIMKAKLADPTESWTAIAKRLEGRTALQCRKRWTRNLDPEINSEPWTPEEDQLLVDKVNEMGTAWAAMKSSFKGRTSNAIRTRWHGHIKSKTVHDGTKFIYTESDPISQDNHRKECGQRKTCPKELALAILKERQLLPEMGNGFDRPSENAVRNRWLRDLQFETVDDGGMSEAVLSMPQEEWASDSLLIDSTRWDQMTTEDEWLPLTPREPDETVGTIEGPEILTNH